MVDINNKIKVSKNIENLEEVNKRIKRFLSLIRDSKKNLNINFSDDEIKLKLHSLKIYNLLKKNNNKKIQKLSESFKDNAFKTPYELFLFNTNQNIDSLNTKLNLLLQSLTELSKEIKNNKESKNIENLKKVSKEISCSFFLIMSLKEKLDIKFPKYEIKKILMEDYSKICDLLEENNNKEIKKLLKSFNNNLADTLQELSSYTKYRYEIDIEYKDSLNKKLDNLEKAMDKLSKKINNSKESNIVLDENRNNEGTKQNINQLNNDKIEYNISTVAKKEDELVDKENYISMNSNISVKSKKSMNSSKNELEKHHSKDFSINNNNNDNMNKNIKNNKTKVNENNTKVHNNNNNLVLLNQSKSSNTINNNMSCNNKSQVKQFNISDLLNRINKNKEIASKLLKMLTELKLIETDSSGKYITNRKNKNIYISEKEWEENSSSNITTALGKLNKEINEYKTKQKLSDNIDDKTLVGLFASSKLEKLPYDTPIIYNNYASNINKLSNDTKKEIKLKLSYRLADYIKNVVKFDSIELSKPSIFFCGLDEQLATKKNCNRIKNWVKEIKGKQKQESKKQVNQIGIYHQS